MNLSLQQSQTRVPHPRGGVVVQSRLRIVVEAWRRIVQVAGRVWNLRIWRNGNASTNSLAFPRTCSISLRQRNTEIQMCRAAFNLTIDVVLWRVYISWETSCFCRQLGSINLQWRVHGWSVGVAESLRWQTGGGPSTPALTWQTCTQTLWIMYLCDAQVSWENRIGAASHQTTWWQIHLNVHVEISQ